MAATSLKKRVQHEAYRIVFLQLSGVLLLALVALFLISIKSGLSVFAGGMTYGLPNLIFVWLVFGFVGAQQMNQFVMAFFFGEMIKLILSAILFLTIVKYLPVSLLSTLVGFVGAIISFWVVCLFHFSRR
jgi:ATP synthase protein I